MDTDSLKPHPNNPNDHSPRSVKMYADVLRTNGWRKPICVSKRTGYIIRGHGAWMAAKELGQKQVPVDVQDYESEEMELADLVADNRIKQLSYFSPKKLAPIIQRAQRESRLNGYGLNNGALKLLLEVGKKEKSAKVPIKYIFHLTDEQNKIWLEAKAKIAEKMSDSDALKKVLTAYVG